MDTQTIIGLALGVSHFVAGAIGWYVKNRTQVQATFKQAEGVATELRVLPQHHSQADLAKLASDAQALVTNLGALGIAVPTPGPIPGPAPSPDAAPLPIDFGKFIDAALEKLAERFPHRPEAAK